MKGNTRELSFLFIGAKGFQLFILIRNLEFSVTVVNSMYFLYTAVIRRLNQMNFIEKIQKIDETLRYSFKTVIDFSTYKAMSILVLVVMLIYYNVVVTTVLFFLLMKPKSISAFVALIVYTLLSSTSGVFTYGFVGYVILIEKRMMKVNEKLEEIIRFPPEMLEKQYITNDALCKEMMRYTKIYKNLCSCVEDLNGIYGSSMVLQFAHDFTLLTTQIFLMFYIGFYENREESLPKICALMVLILPNVIKMSFICFSCHMTRNEVGKLSQSSTIIRHLIPSRLKSVACTYESSAMKPRKMNFPISSTCSPSNRFI
jgi:hypothetical protein